MTQEEGGASNQSQTTKITNGVTQTLYMEEIQQWKSLILIYVILWLLVDTYPYTWDPPSLLITHDSALHLNKVGEGGSSSPPPLLDATAPVILPIASMVFVTILLVFRGGGVGRSGKLSHIIAPVGSRRYKTGQEWILGNHFCLHCSYGCSRCLHIG